MKRNHVIWGLLGVVMTLGMWFAWSAPGAVALFGGIAAAFVLWRVIGPTGSWVALVVAGSLMAGVLGWQAATSARCPEPGQKIFLKENKPPVGCSEIRASAASMSMFFGLVALIGLGAPIYARSMRDEESPAI